ncbi:MAG: hypothetical protein GY873_08610 [Bosea sp.]|uniref:hypothetical protein n=1 Tax=Bosea sp. (in: a-proteobacteria) TaxID=1871050 RepID=UPI002395B0A7|nr:hypothetical protein [Bosea sp. (in: a-proteobacteria)]MCP4734240.1 hypothetical protein [Bosea sp. (in: a-proteobacteria)]
MWLRGKTFSHPPAPAGDFPKEALVDVRTFDHEVGELAFKARVVGPSSASHLRVRADDGLIFIVPAADCRLLTQESVP